MTKFENIDSIAVSMVQKALLDVVQSILEQTDSLPSINPPKVSQNPLLSVILADFWCEVI